MTLEYAPNFSWGFYNIVFVSEDTKILRSWGNSYKKSVTLNINPLSVCDKSRLNGKKVSCESIIIMYLYYFKFLNVVQLGWSPKIVPTIIKISERSTI